MYYFHFGPAFLVTCNYLCDVFRGPLESGSLNVPCPRVQYDILHQREKVAMNNQFCVGGTTQASYNAKSALKFMPREFYIHCSLVLCCWLNTHLIYTSRKELGVIGYTQALNGLSVQCRWDVLEQISSICLHVPISISFSRGFRRAPTHLQYTPLNTKTALPTIKRFCTTNPSVDHAFLPAGRKAWSRRLPHMRLISPSHMHAMQSF